jgi:hypothetical protein
MQRKKINEEGIQTLNGYWNKSSSFLIDDNPIKQNTFSPGYHIPVKLVKDLDKNENTCVVILLWRFVEMFIDKNYDILTFGGSFLKIIPKVEHIKL